jgi:hypothetical protein
MHSACQRDGPALCLAVTLTLQVKDLLPMPVARWVTAHDPHTDPGEETLHKQAIRPIPACQRACLAWHMMEATQTAIDMIKCQVLSLFVWSLLVVVCRGGSILTPQAQTKQQPTECSVPKRATSVDSGESSSAN